MEGFPGEIIIFFGVVGIVLILFGAEFVIRTLKEKVNEGEGCNSHTRAEAMLIYTEDLRRENKELKRQIEHLKRGNAFLQDDVVRIRSEKIELQSELKLIKEENQFLNQTVYTALKANGELKREYDKSIFTQKVGETNA